MTRQYLFSSGTLTISPGSSSPEPSTSHRSSQPQLFFSGILTLDNTPPQPDPSPTLDEISDDDQQLPEIAVLAEASCSSPPPNKQHDHGNILKDNSLSIDELSEDQVVLHVPLEQHDKFRRIVHSPGSYSYFFVSRHGQIDEIEVKTSLRHIAAHPLFERQQDTIVDAACLVFDGSKSTVITGCIQEDKQLISRPLSSIISAQTLERPWNKSKKCGVSALTAMIQPHMFASGGYDHQIHLWDLSPTRSSPSSSAIQLSPTSKPLSMKHLSAVQSLLPLRDSSHKLISGGADCVLNAYDLPSERIFNTLKTSNSIYNVHDVASPYCVLLEVAHRDLQFEIRDYRAVPERPVIRFGYECQQVAGKFVRRSSSPQQDLFACGDREGNVRLWDMRNTNHPSKQVSAYETVDLSDSVNRADDPHLAAPSRRLNPRTQGPADFIPAWIKTGKGKEIIAWLSSRFPQITKRPPYWLKNRHMRKLWQYIAHFYRRKGRVLCVAVLGSTVDQWMATDFAIWHLIISFLAGFSQLWSSWLTPLDYIAKFFPDGLVIFGDGGLDKMTFPANFVLSDIRPVANVKKTMMEELRRVIVEATEDDTVIILLVGHGELDIAGLGVFKFDRATLTCRELEDIVGPCLAEVIVVSTACFSGAFESPWWTLLCGADACSMSEAVAGAGDGETGGVFSVCVAAALFQIFCGVTVPLPGPIPYNATSVCVGWSPTSRQARYVFPAAGPQSQSSWR